MSTRDLIDAIAAGDSVATQQAFETEMASRIADRMDTMRQEVAQSMFAAEEVDVEDTELTLEDFTLEQIEDFMQSEEFQQLDEISKKTAFNYYKQATKDVKKQTAARNTANLDVTRNKEFAKHVKFEPDLYSSKKGGAQGEIRRYAAASKAAEKEAALRNRKVANRKAGIDRADKRLTSEDTE